VHSNLLGPDGAVLSGQNDPLGKGIAELAARKALQINLAMQFVEGKL
jgi:hypothetical protein